MVKGEADGCTGEEYKDIATLAREFQAELLSVAARAEKRRDELRAKREFTAVTYVEGLVKQIRDMAESIGTV